MLIIDMLMQRSVFYISFVFLVMLPMAGCKTMEVRAPETVTMPDQWHAAATLPDEITSQNEVPAYWESLGDPLLLELIDEARQANPTVLSAFSALREARAARRLSDGASAPVVTLGAGHRQGYDFDSSEHTRTTSLSADASWEVDLWGKLASDATAAQWREAAVQADLESAHVSLAAEVATTYVALRGDQLQLENALASAAIELETLELERVRHQVGRNDALTLNRLERGYTQTLSSVPALEQRVVEGRRQLAVLLGRLPETLDELIPQETQPLPEAPASMYLPIPAQTLRQRPDVLAAERRLQAAVAQCRSVSASQWPSLTLRGSLGNSAGGLTEVFDLSSLVASLSAQLAYTLFDSGQSQHRIDQCAEQQEQALQRYRQTIAEAVREVENALTGLQTARRRVELLTETISLLDTESGWLDFQIETGQSDYADWLALSSTRLALSQQRVAAQVSELGYVITLIKAVAGPWAGESIQE